MARKVLFIHDHKIMIKDGCLYSRGGLTAKIVENYKKCLGELSICSRVIPYSEGNSLKLSDGDVKHIAFPDIMSEGGFKLIEALNVIQSSIKENDIIIIRLPSISGLMAFFFVKMLKKKYIVEVVGCAYDSYNNLPSLKGKMLAPFYFLLNKLAISFSDNILYVSEVFLPNRYPSFGSNLCFCSDVELTIDSHSLEKRVDRINNHRFDTFKLGMIGSLDASYKGYDTVFNAIQLLNNSS
uniref:hypothetical protein n=1 Tax=Shewanella sp. ECSMB14102 TaxID=1579504 RepID=UPI00190F304A